jgi:hypothetical protein
MLSNFKLADQAFISLDDCNLLDEKYHASIGSKWLTTLRICPVSTCIVNQPQTEDPAPNSRKLVQESIETMHFLYWAITLDVGKSIIVKTYVHPKWYHHLTNYGRTWLG